MTFKMSLYYETAPFVSNKDQKGSLKSRIFSNKTPRSPPKQVYALASETSKWSPILTEVIEKSQLLQLERKVYRIYPVTNSCEAY